MLTDNGSVIHLASVVLKAHLETQAPQALQVLLDLQVPTLIPHRTATSTVLAILWKPWRIRICWMLQTSPRI